MTLIKISSETYRKIVVISFAAATIHLFAGPICSGRTEKISPPESALLDKILKGNTIPPPEFELEDPAGGEPVDYSLYGEFRGIGTNDYRYVLKDREALKAVMVPGVYPNEARVLKMPAYERMKQEGQLNDSAWKVLNDKNIQRAFFIWARAKESTGVKTFFTAQILERAGHISAAIKAYHACVVHFPRTPCWSSAGKFVWYIGPSAVKNIQRLCRDYPGLGLEYIGGKIEIQNGDDIDPTNDVVIVHPGKIVRKNFAEKMQSLPILKNLKVVEQRGRGKVRFQRYENGHWQMFVDGKPFFIRGISYRPTEVGVGPHSDRLYSVRWMSQDKNKNGRVDGPYDAWVDENRDDRQDKEERSVGDFRLLHDIGINALRFHLPVQNEQYDPTLINKPLLRDLFKTYGIRVIVGDFLGAYTVGSGATWEEGTDYRDPEQRRRMKAIVRRKVLDLKDEPFVLMWLLGNENNMSAGKFGVNATRTNAASYPKAYAEFLNEVAEMIHELDPHHPVGVGNQELGLLEYYKDFAPAIDVLVINSYRGKDGFGNLWEEARKRFDRPVLIGEYGCDAYYEGRGLDEEGQLEYHRGNFRDIVVNQAGGPAAGNAVGGIIFQYLDEWWKDTHGHPEDRQQTEAQSRLPFPDGLCHEEWFGIVGQGNGKNSPFQRHLRKAYYFYKEMTVR